MSLPGRAMRRHRFDRTHGCSIPQTRWLDLIWELAMASDAAAKGLREAR